jgi:RNA polymerase sigma-70 factor (ECF subfamily)
MPPETLAALYDAHAAALYRFLLSLTASEPDTRDLLQDLFVKLARQSGPAPDDPQAYLFRAARNGFIDLVRHSARRRDVLNRYQDEQGPPQVSAPDPAATPDPTLAIAHALASLPEEQRAVVHLKIWENLTFARIAEIMAIPANTAASRYRYAMDHLRQTLPHPASYYAP